MERFARFWPGAYQLTLAKSLVIAFFLTMILGLGESVSIQSMTVTIQALRTTQPTLALVFGVAAARNVHGVVAGGACGLVVGLVVLIWQHAPMAALVIGASVTFCLLTACVTGLSVPALLHALKLDPKIAAGPITLAVADIFTLLFYFNLAKLLL